MTKLWCKLWNFFLRVFNQLVETAATMLKTIGRAVVDVLADALDAVGDAVDSIFDGSTTGKIILLAGGAALLYFLFGSKEEKGSNITLSGLTDSPTRTTASPHGGVTV